MLAVMITQSTTLGELAMRQNLPRHGFAVGVDIPANPGLHLSSTRLALAIVMQGKK
jgi:hypothetical protein